MGFKSVVFVVALVACLAFPALAGMPLGPKSIVNQPFPTQNMSGYQIIQDVTTGSDPTQSDLSFRNESLFLIDKNTGMSPGAAGKGVRTPILTVYSVPIAGVWSLTLTDVGTKSLTLTLFQSGDAVFGSGQLTFGSSMTQVTAGGTILGDKLAMFVIPAGSSDSMYRFSLKVSPGSMGGDYLYSAPGIAQPGIAFGNTIALQMQAIQQ